VLALTRVLQMIPSIHHEQMILILSRKGKTSESHRAILKALNIETTKFTHDRYTPMSNTRIAKRMWLWINRDGSRWKLAKTDEGFWFCPVGSGGKRRGPWEAGFPPGLDDIPPWHKQS